MSPKWGAESAGKGMQETTPPGERLEGDDDLVLGLGSFLGVFGGEIGPEK